VPENPRTSRRRLLVATGAAASAVALAGCNEGDRPASPTTDTPPPDDGGSDGDDGNDEGGAQTDEPGTDAPPRRGGTLQLVNATNGAGGFDPVASGNTTSGRVVQQLFDGLFAYVDGTVHVEPLLAEGYEASEDFTTYRFRLTDATFHDGSAVTAEDVVYSLRRLAFSPHSVRSYFVLDTLGVVEEGGDGGYGSGGLGVYAEDESTVRLELAAPFHSTLQVLSYPSFGVHPTGVVGNGPDGELTADGEPTEAYRRFHETEPVGAGPFRFDSWERGSSVDVSRFEEYHGQTASLDGVHWEVIEDDQAAYQYAMNGNADYFGIPTANYDPGDVQDASTDDSGRVVGEYGPLPNGETVNYLKVPRLSTAYLGLNTAAVPRPIRRAVAHVFDQTALVEQVFKNRVTPAYHFTPPLVFPGGRSAYDDRVERYPYSPEAVGIERARELTEVAGYAEDDRFSLTLTHFDSQSWGEFASILRQALAAAHVDVTAEPATFGTLLDRGREGNLEAYTSSWVADWPAPDSFLQVLYPPNTDTGERGVLGFVNWGVGPNEPTEASRRATEGFERVRDNQAPSADARSVRNEAYLAVEDANWRDAVVLPFFHGASEAFWYDGVHRPEFGTMGAARQKLNTTWKESDE
jgi:peptide/nickel transport system substrate-binding protein